MDGVARVTARSLAACAVLLGLLFMHGIGTAAETGCAGGTPATTTSMAPPTVTAGHDTAPAEATSSMPDPRSQATSPHAGGHGTVCVSTPPRGEVTGPLTLPVAGLAVPATPADPRPGAVWASSAMPRAGPALLVSLCVSRT
ncbi:DUF6153 family protein [Amycolatopsis saalfeldensis]|uniref:Secreted protein n=1 Tax=Amycolatopsis saalfeldensis TaxID=394193 RepID=A0A1H8YMB6_9PSEU|nr:DUF6153 family protein [Amycolatopsis saalfeldensis]SEP53325.1 hypothetical protein SAMN04489732_12649 [Amycolatopsis saalfeldensis]